VFAAYAAAVKHTGQPTLILPKTVKGYGMGESGEGQMIAHQAKKMTQDALRNFRDRFQIPVSDADLPSVPFIKPADDSPEMTYLRERRAALGGYLPQRRRKSVALEVPPLSTFDRLLKDTGEREISTTMAFVQMLGTLVRDKSIGKHVVPIVPDESRTFGMEGMFRQLGIWSSLGQLYKPQDADQLMYYRESKDGQVLQEGINEGGAMSSWIVAATSYSTNNVPMIPFYIYYSMFGLQRVGDLAWLAGDIRARGFLLGGTAGRTTLNGEGLQHEDGHSHILAGTIPNCVSYDPTFAYEVVTIIRDGMRRMYAEQEDVYYYVTLMNENYPHPGMPEGSEAGILKGLYQLSDGGKSTKKGQRVQLLGSGTILREVMFAAELLKSDFGIAADVWSATSFNELRRDGMDRRTLEPAASERAGAQEPRRVVPRRSRRPGRRRHGLHAQLCRPGARAGAGGRQALHRARDRRLRTQRLPQEAATLLRGRPLARRGRRAEGAGRRRRDQARGRCRRDRQVRP
jgi:pyruvate dehydrogenase E1 component